MAERSVLSLSYDDLHSRELLFEFDKYDEILVVTTWKQSKLLQFVWRRYLKLMNAHSSNVSKITIVYLWLCYLMSYVYSWIRYKHLANITTLYTTAGKKLASVEFKDQSDGSVCICFKNKTQ